MTSVGHALCHGTKVALPVMTLTRAADELNGSLEFMGACVTVFAWCMAASSVPAGLLADRIGTSRTLAIYFLFAGVGAALCAWAPDAWSFLFAYGVLGLSAGVFHPAGLGLLSLSVPGAELGRAMGTFGVVGSVGMAATPLIMSAEFGWRYGFGLMAALGIAGALATVWMIRAGLLLPGVPPPEGAVKAHTPARRRVLLILLVAMGGQAFLLEGFMPLYPLTLDAGPQLFVKASTMSAAILLLGALGQWVGGRLSREHFLAERYALLMLFLPLVLFGLSTSLAEPAWPFMLMGSFAFLAFILQPIENRLLATYTSKARRSSAYALKFVVALAISAPGAMVVTQLLGDGWGFASVWRVFALVGIVPVMLAVWFLRAQQAAVRARVG
ncbi:MAG: MFS transporter [Planctomycetota bacterium]|nr:MAG: MFS transporter [Planctomycetota bacterium]